MSLTFLLLHIVFQITINSLEAGKSIKPDYNCEYPLYFSNVLHSSLCRKDIVTITNSGFVVMVSRIRRNSASGKCFL